jgi:DNA-binding transcriptional LysR family regulator
VQTVGTPLARLDLNLVVALDALLSECSVTGAAKRLSLSQPALSASLARLRRHFGDELLVRQGNRYELTPMAIQLRPLAAAALAGLDQVFERPVLFDPATSTREFHLVASDYAFAVLGSQIANLLAAQAPQARVRFSPNTPSVVADAMNTLREADALLLPYGFVTGLPHAELYSDDWVCLVSADNSKVGDRLTMDHLSEMPWVLTYNEPASFTPPARQLQILGVQVHVAMVVESFVALPFVVAGTGLIAVIPHRLADCAARLCGVRVLPCPWDALPLQEALWWHPMHESDPEHVWLRSLVTEAASRMRASAAPG